MLGNGSLTAFALTLTVLRAWHYANELHHAAVLMGQDVAVKHECASEIRICLSNNNSSRNDACNVTASVCFDVRGWDRNHVLPHWGVCHIQRFGCVGWRLNPNYLKRIDVDVERVRDSRCVILEHPVLQTI